MLCLFRDTKRLRPNVTQSFLREGDDELIKGLRDVGGVSAKTAKRMADAFPAGRGISQATESQLRHLGASKSQAKRIQSAFRFVDLCDKACERKFGGRVLHSPTDVADVLRGLLGRKEQEYFVVILLDARQRIIDIIGVGMGTLSQVDVHPREVFRDAVRLGAHSIIIAHNHPSGDAEPSSADVVLTERLAEVGRMQGIPVLDHIVVTRDEFVSLSALGLVPTKNPKRKSSRRPKPRRNPKPRDRARAIARSFMKL